MADINLASDKKELEKICEAKANAVLQLKANYTKPFAYRLACRLAKRCEIQITESPEIALNKLSCPDYWYRQMRNLSRRRLEHTRRLCGLINSANQKYCSSDALHEFEWEQAQTKEYLESITLENESGYCLTLAEIAAKNISNPKVRRTEMMVRIKGFEEVAKLQGHVADHITLTCPSKMHSHGKSGRPNPKYDGTTVKEAASYLNRQWQQVRAKLDREGLRFYGVRVAEAHHDSTPHWHLLIFMNPEDRLQIRKFISRYFLKVDGDEKGADARRVRFDSIDEAKGSATGYIAKYISKNIDGEFLATNQQNEQPQQNARKIVKWARDNSIRQFQFFGGPSVSLWRELRKLNHSDDEETEKIRNAVDAGDWAAFVMLMGGVHLPRKHRPLQLVHEPQLEIDTDTGEIAPKLDGYGSPLPPKLIGLTRGTTFTPVKKHLWTKKSSPPAESDLACPPFSGGKAKSIEDGGLGLV